MNRLSWDSTAPRRPRHTRNDDAPATPERDAESELLRPAWDELRKIHRF